MSPPILSRRAALPWSSRPSKETTKDEIATKDKIATQEDISTMEVIVSLDSRNCLSFGMGRSLIYGLWIFTFVVFVLLLVR